MTDADIVERLEKIVDYAATHDVGSLTLATVEDAIAEIERLRAAVRAEREACAKIADHYATMERLGLYGSVAVSEGASKIAAAIRARTEDR